MQIISVEDSRRSVCAGMERLFKAECSWLSALAADPRAIQITASVPWHDPDHFHNSKDCKVIGQAETKLPVVLDMRSTSLCSIARSVLLTRPSVVCTGSRRMPGRQTCWVHATAASPSGQEVYSNFDQRLRAEEHVLTSSTASHTALHLVTEGTYEHWLREQPESRRAWLRGIGFDPKDRKMAHLPSLVGHSKGRDCYQWGGA